MTKEDIINSVYYDQAGYGSVKVTWEDAKKKDSSITIKDVKDWFAKNVARKKEPRGQNSFITPHANFEYQADLFFINDMGKQKYPGGLMMVDHFSKYMVVVPILSTKEGDVMAALIEGFNKMKHHPKMLYTDDEGALSTPASQQYFKDHNIKHIITRGHASVAERAIRTFKDALYKRVDASKRENLQWHDFIFEILLTYNNKLKHTTTRMTPADAQKDSNKLMVWVNNYLAGKQERKYPDIAIGDKVKMLRKKKKGEKERTSVWSDVTYKVDGVEDLFGQMYYKLDGMTRSYPRNALLKVA